MAFDHPRIGFVGFGEVAYHFSTGLRKAGIRRILAYDKNAKEITKGEIVRRRSREVGVPLAPSLRHLVVESDVIFSAVWGNASIYRLRLECKKQDGDWLVKQARVERFTGISFSE
jgi:3-hydroxyisobutyrate dehydrogenase-like beta-hydroxyacid dehydrogenase